MKLFTHLVVTVAILANACASAESTPRSLDRARESLTARDCTPRITAPSLFFGLLLSLHSKSPSASVLKIPTSCAVPRAEHRSSRERGALSEAATQKEKNSGESA